MQLDHYTKIYFLGIGGIGMSALARWFKKRGAQVSGYDAVPTALTQQLIEEGIDIHFTDRVNAIPESFAGPETLVVYTPAIPCDNIQFTYFKHHEFIMLKRSTILGILTRNYKTIAVAGTHGKTTTSALIAHILKYAKMNMVAFLGGVTTNYTTNLVMEGNICRNTVMVVEADEFDRSFLTLFPEIAVVTSIEPDHLDIYRNYLSMKKSFLDFMDRLKKNGILILHESISPQESHAHQYSYGLRKGNFYADNIRTQKQFFEFDLIGFKKKIQKIQLPILGFHNIENAIAASITTHCLGVKCETIVQALNSFKGIKRRFELVIENHNMVYIDDYAHHPTEIHQFINSLRAIYSNKKITIIFQPHLYTRTRDFAKEFAESLSLADEVLLMDIYPAREKPIPGVSADIIFNDITCAVKLKCTKKNVLQKLAQLDIEILATVGAGDINDHVGSIKKLIQKKSYAA